MNDDSDRERINEEGEWFDAGGGLRYATLTPPARGEATLVAPGVRWIRMPLPIALEHINLWLLEDGDGYALVDTGMQTDDSIAAWQTLESGVLAARPLTRIILTHCHPDHMGLAHWLADRHGLPVAASPVEMAAARLQFAPDEAAIEAALAFFSAHGMPDAAELRSFAAGHGYRSVVSGIPRIAAPLVDGSQIPAGDTHWRIIQTGGHTDAHCTLFEDQRRILISGDQVLPTISSNVSLTARTLRSDPLGAFIESLERLGELPGDTLVLPSHGKPFYGIGSRTRELIAHHHEQFVTVSSACREPRSAWDLLPVLFGRRLRGVHRMLGLGEAIAHLEYLAQRDRLERTRGADGIFRYRDL
jgi:glyoxylase-like metal-dependent hydrolase (beta-lactamase superfamily II)